MYTNLKSIFLIFFKLKFVLTKQNFGYLLSNLSIKSPNNLNYVNLNIRRRKRKLFTNTTTLIRFKYVRSIKRKFFFYKFFKHNYFNFSLPYKNSFFLAKNFRRQKTLYRIFEISKKKYKYRRKGVFVKRIKRKKITKKQLFSIIKPKTANLWMMSEKIKQFRFWLFKRINTFKQPKMFTFKDYEKINELFKLEIKRRKHKTRTRHTHTIKFKRRKFYEIKKKKNYYKKFIKNLIDAKKLIYVPRKVGNFENLPLLKIINKIYNLFKRKKKKSRLKKKKINPIKLHLSLVEKNIKIKNFLKKIYFVLFRKKKHNYYITVFNYFGEVIVSISSGQVLKSLGNKRNTKTRIAFFNLPSVVNKVCKKLKKKKIKKIYCFIKNINLRRYAFKNTIRDFTKNKIKILKTVYAPSFSHGLKKKTKKLRRL